VLLSVEFCFTLKTYLKGAPFYNASDHLSTRRFLGKIIGESRTHRTFKSIIVGR